MSHIGTGVVQRPSLIDVCAVEEFVVGQGEVTAGVGHVKDPAESNTLAIVPDATVAGSLQASRRAGRQDANGVVMQGADRELPDIFQLRWSGSQCVILQVKTGKSRVLKQADCQPAPQ